MTNPSYTDEQVLSFVRAYEGESVATVLQYLLADRQRLQAEVEALRRCAVKYLTWHDVINPIEGLERDLRDPDMCGDAALPSSATPNETKEAKS